MRSRGGQIYIPTPFLDSLTLAPGLFACQSQPTSLSHLINTSPYLIHLLFRHLTLVLIILIMSTTIIYRNPIYCIWLYWILILSIIRLRYYVNCNFLPEGLKLHFFGFGERINFKSAVIVCKTENCRGGGYLDGTLRCCKVIIQCIICPF